MEHIVELNTIQEFLQDAVEGNLPTGSHPRNLALPEDYLTAMNTAMLTGPPRPAGGGRQSRIPLHRIMIAFGSGRNNQDFVVLFNLLNGLKSRVRAHFLHGQDV